MEKCFQSLTKDQILRYQVSGASVRMDSKLIQSNVAKNTRLQLCLGVLAKFYKSLDNHSVDLLSPSDKALLEEISNKSVEQYTYRLNKQSASERLETCGALLYRLIDLYQNVQSEEYALLKRLWQDHFELVEQDDTEENEPKPKDTKGQPGSTLQSATVRTKKGKYRIIENHAKQAYRYFEQKTITNYFRRKQMENYPQWVHALRANSEATIHQVFCKLNGMKSKYRGLFKHHQYALNRCFWTNFKRIQAKNIEFEGKSLLISLFTMASTTKHLRRIFRNFSCHKLFDKILYCYFKERFLFRGF